MWQEIYSRIVDRLPLKECEKQARFLFTLMDVDNSLSLSFDGVLTILPTMSFANIA